MDNWTHIPYELPPFNEIKPGDFEDALKKAMKLHLGMIYPIQNRVLRFLILARLKIEDLKNISESKEAPTFENTIVAFDNSGHLLGRTGALFENLCSSNGVPELQAVELAMAAPLAAHNNQVQIIYIIILLFLMT